MLFNSLEFLIFYPVVTAGYFLAAARWRWAWLLAASCYFYMAFVPAYLLILAFTILVDYWAGLAIEASSGARRRTILLASIAANVGVLAFFKYFNFLDANLSWLLGRFGAANPIPALDILLPIGLSFHTFQSLSYTIEVYRGRQKAERRLGLFALYVMFYPQLVAGPIERPQNLLHQLAERHAFDPGLLREGLTLMLWGLFKKVAVADRLAPMVGRVFDRPDSYAGHPILLATFFFAFQIYLDFSAYSDIAQGAARTMGIRLMDNFDCPYLSRSVTEFWKRWHISLSTWFRDYVYLPLGGARVAAPRWAANAMITFLLSGLWHGANWTFVLWGGLNGAYLVAERFLLGGRPDAARETAARDWPRVALTFSLVGLSWIFFRAATASDALFFVGRAFAAAGELASAALSLRAPRGLTYGFTHADCLAALGLVLVAQAGDWLRMRRGAVERLSLQPAAVRWPLYYALAAAVFFLGRFQSRQFIYFQF